MAINTAFGIVTAFIFFLPVFLIVYFKMFLKAGFLALAVYFFLTMIYMLMAENIIPASLTVRKGTGAIANYLDAPLVLSAMLMFCRTKQKWNAIVITILLLSIYEIIIAVNYGLKPESTIYISGVSIAIIFAYSFSFFIGYIKLSVEQNKEQGKTLMISSILFAYGIYALVYYLFYIQRTPEIPGVQIIYYFASMIFSFGMSLGLNKYYQQLKTALARKSRIEFYSKRMNC